MHLTGRGRISGDMIDTLLLPKFHINVHANDRFLITPI